ncbi:MAG: S8 family serine peptidase, partial [Oscillospiraceae bacterium]|nr:S8 family serine peptidase [Oscillospiraceae bacterium]
KTYIVYPKEEIALFSADENAPEYMVIGEEELNMLLEEAPEMIDWYEEDISLELFDTVTYDPWDFRMVGASASYAKNLFGEGITIGVIDTGVWKDHPDLKHLNIQGYDYGDMDEDFSDPAGHGTHVTGRIAAAINEIGVDSLAPKATVVMFKCMDKSGEQPVSAIDKAIRAAVDYGCDVINMSLGTSKDSDTLREAVQYAIDKDVIIVAAVGNYANSTLYYPAAYDGVIGVGAVDKEKNIWVNPDINVGVLGAGSQKNKSVFITAPGADAISTFLNADDGVSIYAKASGTSCSAPVVTGAVAVILEAAKKEGKTLSPADIRNILANSATDDAKGDGYDTAYGHGILDVAAAIELAVGNEMLAPDTVTYTVSAENSELNDAITVENYTIGNIGSHPLGTSFTAKAEPTYTTEDGTTYKFAYWANGNGTHVSGEATYTFTATSNFTLRAVYDKVSAGEGEAPAEKTVEFWNGNGVLLGAKSVNSEGKVNSENIPQNDAKMTGYVFSGWLDDEKNEFSAESVLEKNLTRVVAQFKDTAEQYSITFDDVADKTESGVYGKKVTYTASGTGFDYWVLGEKVFSYTPSLEVALWGTDKKLTAVYDKENVIAKPTVVLDKGADTADFLIYSVPNGYTIVDAGIVFGKTGEKPRIASFRSKASVKELPKKSFGQFTSLPGDPSHTVARGYLIFRDPDNVIRVIYSD